MSEQATTSGPLNELGFTVSAFIAKPPAEVYEAIVDPEILSEYFTTGGAKGRIQADETVTWAFADADQAVPVTVVEAIPDNRIVLRWEASAATSQDPAGTTATFVLEPVDEGARTKITISESAWHNTPAGAEAAFGNCEGWTGMLAALKVWLEHGIKLREGFYN